MVRTGALANRASDRIKGPAAATMTRSSAPICMSASGKVVATRAPMRDIRGEGVQR